MAYRAGFFVGTDYVQVKEKLPVFGATFGLGLPLRNFNRQNDQATLINLAFEYIKRGNNDNLLKENMFRISVGFSLSDFWFQKGNMNKIISIIKKIFLYSSFYYRLLFCFWL